MPAPFATGHMAAGYASARPPVHPPIIDEFYRRSGKRRPFRHALDVGCGAGLSTEALEYFAERRTGIEPVSAMLERCAAVAPTACFANAAAEYLPFPANSFDLITAAGSLNYVDLRRFFPEASRVLQDDGLLLVYDFSPGVCFRDRPGRLEEWFAAFRANYPYRRSGAVTLDPEILSQMQTGLCLKDSHYMDIAIVLTPEFYLEYMLTETNVADAMLNGAPYEEIRGWCKESLARAWTNGPEEVVFPAYYVALTTCPTDARG